MQTAIIVYGTTMPWAGSTSLREGEHNESLYKLNQLLEQGWKVISCNPMGGAGIGNGGEDNHSGWGSFASIVILEKEK